VALPLRSTAFIPHIQVEPLPPDEGGGFVAWVPDLPGCMSDGATPAEAIANATKQLTNGLRKPCGCAALYQRQGWQRRRLL